PPERNPSRRSTRWWSWVIEPCGLVVTPNGNWSRLLEECRLRFPTLSHRGRPATSVQTKSTHSRLFRSRLQWISITSAPPYSATRHRVTTRRSYSSTAGSNDGRRLFRH